MIDLEGKETIYYYDPFNRLEMVENELGEQIQYDYDEYGNKTLEVDGANKQKVYSYDHFQQLKTVTEDNGAVTTYYYDPSGNMRASVMADGYTKTLWYNEYGELIEEKRGSDSSITYEYDTAGNLIKVQDRKGQEINVFYNRLGMPVKKEFHDLEGDVVEQIFTYDRGGNQTWATQQTKLAGETDATNISSIELIFNQLGQVETENQSFKGQSYSMNYDYDDVGNLTDITYPDATQPVTYQYNGYNRITGVSGSYDLVNETSNGEMTTTSLDYSASAEYTTSGFMDKLKYSNNGNLLTTTLLNPDDLYRQEQIMVMGHKNQNGYYKDVIVGTQMFNMSYVFDGAGNVTDRTNNLTGYVNSYGYDDVHNLTSAMVEGAFVQERAGTELLAEGDFKGQSNLVAVSGDQYEVALECYAPYRYWTRCLRTMTRGFYHVQNS